MVNKLILSQSQVDKMIISLIEKVRHIDFDIIIAIMRGGYPIAESLGKALGKPVQKIYISNYDGEVKRDKPIVDFLQLQLSPLQTVLCIDDLVDSGDTAIFFDSYLKENNIESLFATLFVKPTSKFRPHFFIEETTDWVVFPWE